MSAIVPHNSSHEPRCQPDRLNLRLVWPSVFDVADNLFEEVIRRNRDDFSFSLREWGEPHWFRDQDVYVVSYQDYERILPFPLDHDDVMLWVLGAHHMLTQGDNCVGGYEHEGGAYVLDVSYPVWTQTEALALARSHGQAAIFHPASGQCIPTGLRLVRVGDRHVVSEAA